MPRPLVRPPLDSLRVVHTRSVKIRTGGTLLLNVTANVLRMSKQERELLKDILEKVAQFEATQTRPDTPGVSGTLRAGGAV